MPELTPLQVAHQVLDPHYITIAKNKPGQRNSDAVAIQRGACNPSGIARSLVSAIEEFHRSPEYTGTDSVKADPAIRMICHQLGFLLNLWAIDNSPGLFVELDNAINKGDAEFQSRLKAEREGKS